MKKEGTKKDLIVAYKEQEKNNTSLLFSKFSNQKLDKIFLILFIVWVFILLLVWVGIINTDLIEFTNSRWVQVIMMLLLIDLHTFYVDSAKIQGYKDALDDMVENI